MTNENDLSHDGDEGPMIEGDESVAPTLTPLELTYLTIICGLSFFAACAGIHIIVFSDNELPTGPAMMIIGAVMTATTILKFTAERKRALDPVKLHKAVFGPETVVGMVVAVTGLVWHLTASFLN